MATEKFNREVVIAHRRGLITHYRGEEMKLRNNARVSRWEKDVCEEFEQLANRVEKLYKLLEERINNITD